MASQNSAVAKKDAGASCMVCSSALQRGIDRLFGCRLVGVLAQKLRDDGACNVDGDGADISQRLFLGRLDGDFGGGDFLVELAFDLEALALGLGGQFIAFGLGDAMGLGAGFGQRLLVGRDGVVGLGFGLGGLCGIDRKR